MDKQAEKMPGKNSQFSGSIRTGNKLTKFLARHKRLIILVGIVIALLTGFAIWWTRVHHKDKGPTYKATLQAAADLQNQQKPAAALQTVLNYLATNPNNKTERGGAELLASRLSSQTGDHKAAAQWGEKAIADTDKPDYGIYKLQAENYKVMHDKQNALKYYKLAQASLGKPTDPAQIGQLNYVKRNISLLETGKD